MYHSKNEKEIENCLVSELRNMVSELKLGNLTEELVYNYFRNFMYDAGVHSKIIVNVLEQFGELGKDEARNIKVSEGW
jgi:hypothetical protein